ncbi:MAG: hypothetical protein M0C28_30760 [Candidatus Moduliflexus flocculans]|nr:hypothetical protein [Candidatus Moduliflexus flocculans]
MSGEVETSITFGAGSLIQSLTADRLKIIRPPCQNQVCAHLGHLSQANFPFAQLAAGQNCDSTAMTALITFAGMSCPEAEA